MSLGQGCLRYAIGGVTEKGVLGCCLEGLSGVIGGVIEKGCLGVHQKCCHVS